MKNNSPNISPWLLFSLSIGGGAMYGLGFFLVFGVMTNFEDADILAALCFAAGLVFVIAMHIFFLVYLKVKAKSQFINKRFEKEKERLQKKLGEYCSELDGLSEEYFEGKIRKGKGLGANLRECRLYFKEESLTVVHCGAGRVKLLDLPYSKVVDAHTEGSLLYIVLPDVCYTAAIRAELKDIVPTLAKRGRYSEVNSYTTGKLFNTRDIIKGRRYVELRYCKEQEPQPPSPTPVEDSLFIHYDDFEAFFDGYLSCLMVVNEKDGGEYVNDYYTWEQAKTVWERVKESAPRESGTTIPWLEKSFTRYNGFYVYVMATGEESDDEDKDVKKDEE